MCVCVCSHLFSCVHCLHSSRSVLFFFFLIFALKPKKAAVDHLLPLVCLVMEAIYGKGKLNLNELLESFAGLYKLDLDELDDELMDSDHEQEEKEPDHLDETDPTITTTRGNERHHNDTAVGVENGES